MKRPKKVNALVRSVRDEDCEHSHVPYRGSMPCTGGRGCTMCGEKAPFCPDCGHSGIPASPPMPGYDISGRKYWNCRDCGCSYVGSYDDINGVRAKETPEYAHDLDLAIALSGLNDEQRKRWFAPKPVYNPVQRW